MSAYGQFNKETEGEREEHLHFQEVVRAFDEYELSACWELARRARCFATISPEDAARLPGGAEGFLAKLAHLRVAARTNQGLFDRTTAEHARDDKVLLRCADLPPALRCDKPDGGDVTRETMFAQALENVRELAGGQYGPSRAQGLARADAAAQLPPVLSAPRNTSKCRSCLHQYVRDWADEGELERKSCYEPLLAELVRWLPPCRLGDVDEVRAGAADAAAPGGDGDGDGAGAAGSGDASSRSCKRRRTSPQRLAQQLRGQRNSRRVLVPGAGLGRLACEICARGYACQGNEFSYFMLLSSSFALNALGSGAPRSAPIFPWIENSCNVFDAADTQQEVRIPDVPAVKLLYGPWWPRYCDTIANGGGATNGGDTMVVAEQDEQGDAGGSGAGPRTHAQGGAESGRGKCDDANDGPQPDFSMCAGEFLIVYGEQKESWDAIVTCFFIDCAPNPIRYIEAIWDILRPGGVWVNIGPLLYHWQQGKQEDGQLRGDDDRYGQSIELSYSELKHVIEGFGFEYLSESRQTCTYTRDARSMMYRQYECVLFTVRKPDDQ